MQFVVDNYDTIAEAALIVPMDETQAEEASSALEGATAAKRQGPAASRTRHTMEAGSAHKAATPGGLQALSA